MRWFKNVKLSVMLGVIGALGSAFSAFTIYTYYFDKKAPDLRIEIQSVVPVFSLREDVENLEVYFKGQNLRQVEKELTLIILKLVNRGRAPIRTGDFDSNYPLIIYLDSGEIVRHDVIESSDIYFEKVFSETKIEKQSIVFPKFLFERNDFLSLQTLIMHEEGDKPLLKVKGKIANNPELMIIQAVPDTYSESSFGFLLGVLLPIIFVLIIILFSILYEKLTDKLNIIATRKRCLIAKRKMIETMSNYPKNQYVPLKSFIDQVFNKEKNISKIRLHINRQISYLDIKEQDVQNLDKSEVLEILRAYVPDIDYNVFEQDDGLYGKLLIILRNIVILKLYE